MRQLKDEQVFKKYGTAMEKVDKKYGCQSAVKEGLIQFQDCPSDMVSDFANAPMTATIKGKTIEIDPADVAPSFLLSLTFQVRMRPAGD